MIQQKPTIILSSECNETASEGHHRNSMLQHLLSDKVYTWNWGLQVFPGSVWISRYLVGGKTDQTSAEEQSTSSVVTNLKLYEGLKKTDI